MRRIRALYGLHARRDRLVRCPPGPFLQPAQVLRANRGPAVADMVRQRSCAVRTPRAWRWPGTHRYLLRDRSDENFAIDRAVMTEDGYVQFPTATRCSQQRPTSLIGGGDRNGGGACGDLRAGRSGAGHRRRAPAEPRDPLGPTSARWSGGASSCASRTHRPVAHGDPGARLGSGEPVQTCRSAGSTRIRRLEGSAVVQPAVPGRRHRALAAGT